MQVWDLLHAARRKHRMQKVAKNRHLGTIAQLCMAISSQLRHILTIGKNLLSSNMSSTCFHNMVNFGLLAAEIGPVVWGTPANFNGFRVLAALLHGTPVLGFSQTLRRWTEGATYIRQGRPSRWALAHILVIIIAVLIFHVLKIHRMTAFCNLLMEWLSHNVKSYTLYVSSAAKCPVHIFHIPVILCS